MRPVSSRPDSTNDLPLPERRTEVTTLTTDRYIIESIIDAALVCRIAMVSDSTPYIYPVCFGYESNTLYFHSAVSSRKLEILGRNSRVSFQLDTGCQVVYAQEPCEWSMTYRSVIGSGVASQIGDLRQKVRALRLIAGHYGASGGGFSSDSLERTAVVRIAIQEMTAKTSGFDQQTAPPPTSAQ
jgi:nitroimidazol reductase NimA-like FMN-containing flavoprotein (pyridoxamine 5'-phosphate oxidase superfamily)